MRDSDPSSLPVGKGSSELLKKYPHALYSHILLAIREQIWKDINAIKMWSLVLDQRTFRSEPTMTLVQDPETRTLQFRESNSVREIANWHQWQCAFRTYKSIYLMLHPKKELEMTKYKMASRSSQPSAIGQQLLHMINSSDSTSVTFQRGHGRELTQTYLLPSWLQTDFQSAQAREDSHLAEMGKNSQRESAMHSIAAIALGGKDAGLTTGARCATK